MSEQKAQNEQQRLMELSKARLRNDSWQMHNSLSEFVRTVHPKTEKVAYEDVAVDSLYYAFQLVCQASKIRPIPINELAEKKTKTMDVDFLARVSQINLREVLLAGDWWKEDNGPILSYYEIDGRPVALLPNGPSSYLLHDVGQKQVLKVTEEIADQLQPHGVVLYRPFPSKKLNLIDVMKFAGEGIWIRDAATALAISLVAALIGLIVPKVTQQIFDVYIPGGEVPQLAQVGLLMVGFLFGRSLFELSRSMAMLRIEGKMESSIQSAVWDRLLALPVGFFKDYTAGELAMRAFGISQIRSMISGAMTNTILTSVFSLLYLFQVFQYGKDLAVYAVVMIALLMAFSYAVGRIQTRQEKKLLENTNKTSGLVLQLFNAIAKFRVAGAENRAFKQWADLFTESRQINFRKETITTIITTITTAAPLVFNLVFYMVAVRKGMELQAGMFIAFTTAFGSLSGSMISIINTVIQLNVIKPTYEMSKPILETLPEYSTSQDDPGQLAGSIKVNGLSFRYEKDGPNILKNINLEIREGEYVAIVGPSGSGKSTLFRLLLGFETPDAGQVYYDDKDLATVNVREVRRQMGVVMQNAQLMTGDIFSNIVGANTRLTMDDAMRAVKMAGMEEDIAQMPMGMHTVVSEGATTLSGGQRQRLLIARSIVSNPKILFFDEATSALDNKTQKVVQESLDGLLSTRVIIAHRLSTIINCDRIIVVDKGEIVEEGNFERLMKLNGIFSKMASRQIA
jgi:NHLM bacteriocin system ABC transporter ATP-binding protein